MIYFGKNKNIFLLDASLLKPHEKTSNSNYKTVLDSFYSEKILFEPIVVDLRHKVILDGHHRTRAFLELGIEKIPSLLVDYSSPEIRVFLRNNNLPVSKSLVIKNALNEELFPAKTTRHLVNLRPKIKFKLGVKK